VVGHLYAEKDKGTSQNYCEFLHLLNFLIGAVFFLGYYEVVDELITLLFSKELVISRGVAFVITLNGFIRFMRHSVLTFKDASGTFYQDRWKPLIEGVLNIILSIFLVRSIGISGALVATIITNLLICHVVEPYVLYRNAFSASPKRFYIKNYSMIFVFTLMLAILDNCLCNCANVYVQLLTNGLISIAISVLVCCVLIVANFKEFRRFKLLLKKG
jgi:Na+-driven multidrug efflux pump